MIEALVDAIGKPAEGSGLRIDPDIEPDRLVAPHGRDRGGDGDSGDDSDGDGDNDRSNVLIGSLGWLQRAAARALSLARSGAGFACVRHDPANGRIGLLLRRCPALEVMLEQSGERLHFSAWLHGCSPPERAMAPPVGPRHLSEAGGGGEARGSELERCRLPLRAGWEAPLLWQLGKIYCCCRHGEADGGQGALYPAADNDLDAWAKVEWDETDLEEVAARAVEAATLLDQQLRRSGSGACAARLRLELCFGPRAVCEASPEEPRVPLGAARRLACSADAVEVGAASATGRNALERASSGASNVALTVGSSKVRAGLVTVLITDFKYGETK